MADEALVREACNAYNVRQDGLLDLYHIPGIMYILGLHPTESMYNNIGQAEEEDQYYININLAVRKIMEMKQSQEDTRDESMHPLPPTSPLSSPEFDDAETSNKNPSAIPPLPRTSPLSSPEFDQDEFRDATLEHTYQRSRSPHQNRNLRNVPSSSKVLGMSWNFEESAKLPPYIIQLPPRSRKESRDPRIRSKLRRQERAKEMKPATIQID